MRAMHRVLVALAVVAMTCLPIARTLLLTVDPKTLVPLPKDFDIRAPGPAVPPEIARAFTAHGSEPGAEDIRHILVVEHVTADGHADVVFVHGDSAFYGARS
jgi:hypothetical protein